MKLQRLAGLGPLAAFVSAVALFVVAVIQQAMVPPSLFVVVAIVFLVAFFIWVAALTTTLFDLEWLEHRATRTWLFRIALGLTVIAMVMPGVVALIVFAGLPVNIAIPWSLLLACVGISLLVHNIEARRARLLHGALPWIGIAAGAGYLYLGILQFVFMFTPVLVMGFVYGLLPTHLLYLVWSVWMGVHLLRSRSKASANATATATA